MAPSRSRPSRSQSSSTEQRDNQNGLLVQEAISDLNKVATRDEIIAQLMLRIGRTDYSPELAEAIDHTLKEGVRMGFIQMQDGGYCHLPTPNLVAGGQGSVFSFVAPPAPEPPAAPRDPGNPQN